MKHYLLVDLGTGNRRVALVDANGAILGVRTYANVSHRAGPYEDAQMSALTQSPQPAPVRALYC